MAVWRATNSFLTRAEGKSCQKSASGGSDKAYGEFNTDDLLKELGVKLPSKCLCPQMNVNQRSPFSQWVMVSMHRLRTSLSAENGLLNACP